MLTNRGVLQSNQNFVLKCSFSGDFDDISVNIQEGGFFIFQLTRNSKENKPTDMHMFCSDKQEQKGANSLNEIRSLALF